MIFIILLINRMQCREYIDTWAKVRDYVDEGRWNEVNLKLIRQAKDALKHACS